MKKTVLNSVEECPVFQSETKSPFAVYQGEQMVKKTACNQYRHITTVNANEIDKLIIVALNQYLVITSSLLEKALQNMGVAVDQTDLQKRLRILSAGEYLDAFRFQSETARSSNLVYIIGWRGAGFLKANGIKPLGGVYLKELTPTQIKQLLSAAQFLIKTKVDIDDFTMRELVVVSGKADGGKIFRSPAVVRQADETMLIESVRKCSDWEKYLSDKLQRIDSVVTDKGELNVPICKKGLSVLLVAEDTIHMQQVMRLIEKHFRSLSIPALFSCDSLTYSQPDNCVFSVAKKPGFFASLFSA